VDGTGTLTISDGGTVTDSTGIVGQNAGSSGSATISGTNSQWTNSSTLTAGDGGSGTVTVSDGCTVIDGTTTIENQPGSTGTVDVSGQGSTLNTTGTGVIGAGGSGTLDISNGGVVNDGSTTIAQNPGSSGTVDVSGPGSTLNTMGTAIIGESGSGTLDITNGGVVNDGSTTIAQNTGSSGTVDVSGPGSTLNNSGSSVVGGNGSGTLDISNGGVVNDGSTTIAQNPGSTGTVDVMGSGSTLNNTGTLSVGPAGIGTLDVIDGGAVTANGGTTVGPNGTVTGDGTITTPTLVNNGTVAPAGANNTPGTLTLNGNYQQGPGGVLDSEVGGPQSSQADQLKISGTATLNGTLTLTSLHNFHPSSGDTYTILTAAGGLTGKFNQVVDTLNTNGLTRTDVIGPNGVLVSYLRPVPKPPPATPSASPAPPASITLTTPNPLPTTPLTAAQKNAILVPIVNPNVDQLAAPFEVWFSGANTQRFNIENRFDDIIAGSTGFVSNVSYPTPPPTGKQVMEGKGVADGKGIKEVAPSPLQPAPENRWGVWVTGFGDFVNVDNEGSAEGYNFTTGGVTVGIDYRLTESFVIGLMGGYAHTWTDLNPRGSVDVNTGWGGGYAGYFSHGLYIDGAVFGGADSFDTSRAALLGGNATGSSNGYVFSTFIAAGYDFHIGQLTIGPTASLQYSSTEINGFSENGSIAPVKVSSDTQDSLRTDLGFRAWYDIRIGQIGMRPFVRAAWEHEYAYSALPISANLVDIPGPPVTVNGPSLGHDSAVVNAGVAVQWTRSFSTYASYDGQLGRTRYNSNGVSGGLRFSF
jgi:T5SS/PEP-CTERM-associated repeat protein